MPFIEGFVRSILEEEMFSKLGKKIQDLKEEEDGLNGSALIIAIVTPFMCRVHSMVGFYTFSFSGILRIN